MKVIDISHYNGKVDFKKLKKACIDGVIIRLGYRGYSKGALILDGNFYDNLKGAEAEALKVGVYFVTQAITEEEAIEEARFTLSKIKNTYPYFPIFVDTENGNAAKTGRADEGKLTLRQRTNIIKAFCQEVEKNGYKAGIYASESWFKDNLYFNELINYYIWVAKYSKYKPTIKYDAWQYTSTGRIEGINAYFDINDFIVPVLTNEQVADEVIAGKWGNGAERKIRLTAAGYNYEEVQKIVNKKVQPQKPKEIYYIIKKGDTLTSIAKMFTTTVKQLQAWNNIKDANKIKAGVKIRVR